MAGRYAPGLNHLTRAARRERILMHLFGAPWKWTGPRKPQDSPSWGFRLFVAATLAAQPLAQQPRTAAVRGSRPHADAPTFSPRAQPGHRNPSPSPCAPPAASAPHPQARRPWLAENQVGFAAPAPGQVPDAESPFGRREGTGSRNDQGRLTVHQNGQSSRGPIRIEVGRLTAYKSRAKPKSAREADRTPCAHS